MEGEREGAREGERDRLRLAKGKMADRLSDRHGQRDRDKMGQPDTQTGKLWGGWERERDGEKERGMEREREVVTT